MCFRISGGAFAHHLLEIAHHQCDGKNDMHQQTHHTLKTLNSTIFFGLVIQTIKPSAGAYW